MVGRGQIWLGEDRDFWARREMVERRQRWFG
jgi:hypothetical protein